MLALEAVHERVHFHRRHQVAVEENILDVQEDLQLRGLFFENPHRVAGAPVADIVRHRLVIRAPRDVDGAGHDQHVLDAEIVRGLGDLAGQLDPARALVRVVA